MTALNDEHSKTFHLQPSKPSFFAESFIQLCQAWTPRASKRILLVDDDYETRKVLRALLEMEGYTVFSCSDGENAMEVLLSCGPIDLLLTDFHMPNLSGADLAERFSQMLPSAPVLIISGAILTDDVRENFAVRGWSFLPKPFPVTALLRKVEHSLQPESAAARARTRGMSHA